MTELKIVPEGKLWKVIDNHNLKKGKAYRTIFKGDDSECIEFLKQKGLVKIW